MVVKHTNATPTGTNLFQVLYATPAVIGQIQNALAAVNSAFNVAAGAGRLRGWAPDRSGRRTLQEVVVGNADLPGGETFVTCNANMWHLMGVYRAGGFQRTPNTRLASPVNGRTEFESYNNTAAGMTAVRRQITGQVNVADARTSYQGMWGFVKRFKSWWYGINQYAAPEIAEGIGIIRSDAGGAGQTHFAGVIAKSGHDSVMLENYAGNPGTLARPAGLHDRINPNWYFRMFGPVKRHWFAADEDQTFYGEHLRLGEYGPSPLVVRVSSSPGPPPGAPAPPAAAPALLAGAGAGVAALAPAPVVVAAPAAHPHAL
jgi:hypothetical protein